MARDIRWGIMGTGRVAGDWAGCFSWVVGGRIEAVGSRSMETAKRFAQTHDIPKVYGNYAALLEDDEIDAIYVATPHHRHREDSLQCFEHDKAVLCEKPFALDFAAARDIVAAATDRQVFCMEAMWTRFFPVIQEIKQLLASGEIGELTALEADFGYPTSFDPGNRFFDPKQGGGALLDRGVYLLSLARYLLGKHESVESTATMSATGVDETSSYLLRYPSGATANLSATLTGYARNEAMLYGTHGAIRVHAPFFQPRRFTVFKAKPVGSNANPVELGPMARLGRVQQRLRRLWIPFHDRVKGGEVMTRQFPGAGYQFEINEVNRCLQEGLKESRVMPLQESLDIVKLMDAIRDQIGLALG